MKLISEYDVGYNETALTEIAKFSKLASGPMALTIQIGADFYTAQITYNTVTKWLSLKVYTADATLIQGETFVADFPTNLLTTPVLANYALFYYPEADKLRLYQIASDDWYNSITLDYETAYKCCLLKILPSEIIEK